MSRLAVPTVKEGQSRAVGADHSRGRLQEFTPAPCQHRLLDVVGGRERIKPSWRGKRGRGARLARVLLRATSVVTLEDGKE